MSGTSLDGIDYVLCDVRQRRGLFSIEYIDKSSAVFPPRLKKDLLDTCENKKSLRDAWDLHFKLGEQYCKSLEKIIEKKKWKFELIGLHGQTVYHSPVSTLQIGEPSYLKKFGVPVVSDFRSKNVAFGGPGAPLASYFHKCAFWSRGRAVAYLNLGGMSNVSYFDKNGDGFSSDLGPGNVYVDWAMREFYNKNYDKNGVEALKGLPHIGSLKKFLKEDSFLRKRFPKACGREEYSEVEFKKMARFLKKLSLEDRIATLAEYTVQAIVSQIKNFSMDRLVVGGGGGKNKYFMSRFREELSKVNVVTSDELDWPVDAVEGGAFALLAFMRVQNKAYPQELLKDTMPSVPLGRVQ